MRTRGARINHVAWYPGAKEFGFRDTPCRIHHSECSSIFSPCNDNEIFFLILIGQHESMAHSIEIDTRHA